MDRRSVIVYAGVPLGVSLLLVALYFSGISVLQQIVLPQLGGVYGSSERELGLLENLQNVVLLVMLGMCLRGMKVQPGVLWKVALAGLSCFTLLVFLEEVDYGLHWYELARGIGVEDAAEVRNLHNVGGRTNIIKQVVDLGMLVFFVILPFALKKNENRFVRHFLADRYSVLTLLCALVVSQLAHLLNDMGLSLNGIDNTNTSEFRELVTYYLCMLYYWEVILKRRWGGDANPTPQEQLDEGIHFQTSGMKGEKLSEGLDYISKPPISEDMAEQLGISAIKLSEYEIPEAIRAEVPTAVAQFYRVIPIEFEDGVLRVATTDPTNINALDDLSHLKGCSVEPVLASEEDIREALAKYYGDGE